MYINYAYLEIESSIERLVSKDQRGKVTCLFASASRILEDHIGIFLRGIFGNCIGIIHFESLIG